MLERQYQAKVIKKLEKLFPGCFILKNDSEYVQGILDLTILYKDRWALLEVKKDLKSPQRPNQAFYARVLNEMSFAAFICPENENEVLDALQRSFQTKRSTRISERQ